MSDLINRDAFITYLKTAKASAYLSELADCDTEEAKWRINDEMYYSTQSFIDVLKCRPTVDAVRVVRCKNCIHVCDYTDIYPKNKGYKCIKNGNFHDENWYCADGEQKDREQENVEK